MLNSLCKKGFPRMCLEVDAYRFGYIGATSTVLEKLWITQIPVWKYCCTTSTKINFGLLTQWSIYPTLPYIVISTAHTD